MSKIQRNSQKEPNLSIYDPDCAVHSPHVIEAWADSLPVDSKENEQYANYFLILIPEYCCQEDGKFPAPPEFWQRNLLSYSFFFGLGVTIFDRNLAQYLLYGLTEGPSKDVLFWMNEVGKMDHADNAQLWNHAVNVLTVYTGMTSPETTGPDAGETLVRGRMPIAGFTPAIRLGLNRPDFARVLFEGAIDERENCDDEELIARINWMKAFILDTWSKNQARSSN